MPTVKRSRCKSRMTIRMRVEILKSTSAVLVDLAQRHGFVPTKAIRGRGKPGAGSSVGPLLDCLVEHLGDVASKLPPETFRKYDRTHKLSAESVRLIRASGDKIVVLASEFGVSVGLVSMIRRKTAYKWVS